MYIQLRELKGQLVGISPKLGLYKEIQAKIATVQEQLGGNGISQPKKYGMKEIDTLGGTRIRVRENRAKKPKNSALSDLRCTHRTTPVECRVEECTKTSGSRGKCKSCHQTKYRNYCRLHGEDDLKNAN